VPPNFTHPWIAGMLLELLSVPMQVEGDGGKKQTRRKICQQFQ